MQIVQGRFRGGSGCALSLSCCESNGGAESLAAQLMRQIFEGSVKVLQINSISVNFCNQIFKMLLNYSL
jgi:hypothetical protein